MADETLATDISGPNGLPHGAANKVDRNSAIPLDNADDETVYNTVGEIADGMGDIKIVGAVTGSGKIDDDITVAIANQAVTFAKIQNIAASRLLGRSSAGAGAPQEISVGTGLTLAGTVLQADASGQIPPSIHLYVYQRFGRI